jgi:hypothetical protein
MVQIAEPYVGRYFSQDYVRRKILRQTDEEIIEQDAIIKKEIKDGIIPDPNAPVDPATGMPTQPGMDLGQPVMEPNLDGSTNGGMTQVDSGVAQVNTGVMKMPKGGEI